MLPAGSVLSEMEWNWDVGKGVAAHAVCLYCF